MVVEEQTDVRLSGRRNPGYVGADRRARSVAEEGRAEVVQKVILARITAGRRSIRKRREILPYRADAGLRHVLAVRETPSLMKAFADPLRGFGFRMNFDGGVPGVPLLFSKNMGGRTRARGGSGRSRRE